MLSVELFRRAKLRGYSGGKSALYALVKELRPERVRPVFRFEGLAGEFSQHDFGHVDARRDEAAAACRGADTIPRNRASTA